MKPLDPHILTKVATSIRRLEALMQVQWDRIAEWREFFGQVARFLCYMNHPDTPVPYEIRLVPYTPPELKGIEFGHYNREVLNDAERDAWECIQFHVWQDARQGAEAGILPQNNPQWLNILHMARE